MARRRNRRGTYCKMKKHWFRDRYGTPEHGECVDVIAGHTVRYKLPANGMVRVKQGTILKGEPQE